MLRPGADPDNLTPADFVCDFCPATWSDDNPMVEGHRGSLICARCLTAAFDQVWNRGAGVPLPQGATCTLCLEHRPEPHYRGDTGAHACKRCIKQSSVMLERDPDYTWKRPPGPSGT